MSLCSRHLWFDEVLCDCFQRAVTILDMERRLPRCLKNRYRCGVEKKLGTALGDDCRRCFRFVALRF